MTVVLNDLYVKKNKVQENGIIILVIELKL